MNTVEKLTTAAAHNPDDLIRLFDQLFAGAENTRLLRGEGEPIYLPADAETPYHRVVFAHGYFASALHEIAHWCIAGKQRRQLEDYGYWYAPDGRTEPQQRAFEQVEVKPQALEWILSTACGKRFRVSVDNLSGETTDPRPFKAAVYQQVLAYCRQGIPVRAERLRVALCHFYGSPVELCAEQFSPADIGLAALELHCSEAGVNAL